MRMKPLELLAAAVLLMTGCARGEKPEPAATPKPARGYVLVSTSTGYGFLPLPEEEDYTYPLVQTRTDGTQTVNYIHVTPDGVYMEDSTCEGHDCVEQGQVTFENRKERILGNMIICLPNQVMLQLYTPEELLSLMENRTEDSP